MASLRGHLLLFMLLAVTASEDYVTLQREIGLPTELLDMLKQLPVGPEVTVGQKGPCIKPCSMDLSIPFPLARPTIENILAICRYSNLRPRYTEDMLPKSGFGHLYRQASAVNQLESWFTMCCSNDTQDEGLTLCCAQQAWDKSLSNFCEEEFSIKTSHYHCCRKNGPAKWDCFEKEAPDPLYQPPGHQEPNTIQGFAFNSSSCQKTSVSEIMPRPEMVTEPSTLRWAEQRIVIPPIPVSSGEEEVLWIASDYVSSPQSMRQSISFPLARPTTANILAICQYSNQRPRYLKERLPRSGFGYLHRQASAVNQLESWYTVCCANGPHDDVLTLCCAQQAWEKSLSAFCEEEFTIKTNHYHCCKEDGPAKWDCFEKEASDTSYRPYGHEKLLKSSLGLQVFDFDHNRCQKTSISGVDSIAMTERMVETLHINFPPGRPNSHNIAPICGFHKNRPRYVTSCLPRTGFEWFAHQLKAINGLERSFGQCCKKSKDLQACAERKWKEMVDKFCKAEEKIQVNQFECCKKQRGEEQYDCFSTAAPNPDYMVLNEYSLDIPPSLDMFCVAYPHLQKMKHLPFTVDEMAEQCCILGRDKMSTCLQIQLNNLLDDACNAGNPSLAQVKRKCCKKNAKGHSKCLTKLLLDNIAKATRVKLNPRKCPIL
ncbi:extracellular matrix protein 1 [Pangasianodon hypophthalmus]|uniref:extracellular matrix protein 1 n=1 Tax=Pangasianodon hypophthalmus TaxID=310915 RepID=UPI002307844B|nr:extracellular matrix protein 1 [Pangasianodon hypophthalmus]